MHNATKGVLLMNLGSPDSFKVSDVHRYLTEFLMDKRVMDFNYLLRSWLVKAIIVPRRVKNSAKAYQYIWQDEGSPLIIITKKMREELEKIIELPVAYTMRYGNPTPQYAFEQLLQRSPKLKEVLLLPLYPHYAMSSFETAVLHVERAYARKKYPFSLSCLKPYFSDDRYINSLATSLKPYLNEPYDHILFSYHGVPERHIYKGDITQQHCLKNSDCCNLDSPSHAFCYRHQCLRTMHLVSQKLQINPGHVSIAFQSRLGKEQWLEPYTANRLQDMPKEGIKRLLILCPAFVSDCLETLEEIGKEGKQTFLQAGGEKFTMIPCLNVQDTWLNSLAHWVKNSADYCYEKPLVSILRENYKT